jgi:hypothetical protein
MSALEVASRSLQPLSPGMAIVSWRGDGDEEFKFLATLFGNTSRVTGGPTGALMTRKHQPDSRELLFQEKIMWK